MVEPLQRWQRILVAVMGVTALLSAGLWIRSKNEGGEKVVLRPWVLLESPEPAAAQLVIYVQGGGCNHDKERLGPIDVRESPQQIAVAAHLVKPKAEPNDCNDIGTQHKTVVDLAEPLGDRELVDPTCEPTPQQLEIHDCRPAAVGG